MYRYLANRTSSLHKNIFDSLVLINNQNPQYLFIMHTVKEVFSRCCTGPSLEIAGRDVVACRPAPNGGPFLPPGTVVKKKEKKLLKKMDPTVAGLPVFMLVAYPSKSRAGARQKMILYFHIPPMREDKASMIQDAADNGTGMI